MGGQTSLILGYKKIWDINKSSETPLANISNYVNYFFYQFP